MNWKFFVAIPVMILILSIDGCGKGKTAEENSAETLLGEQTDQKILTFSLFGYSDGGKRSWDLKGDSADVLTTNVVLLDNVLGHSYDKDNSITLTADKGEFDKNQNNLLLKDNVVATTQDGATLTTDHLNWNATKEEVDTDALVDIERENIKITGEGALGQPDLKYMQLKKNVTVELKPSTVITCEGALEVDTQNNKAIFNDSVVVIDERGKLWADKAEVYFDPIKKGIDKVVARGNVKIEREGNVTYSEEASYDAISKLMVLTGRPKLVLYSQEELNALTGN